jgi:predicted nucleotidyltransferase
LPNSAAPFSVVPDVCNMKDDDVVFVGALPLRVDFLRPIFGVPTAELLHQGVQGRIEGMKLKFTCLEHSIVNKRAAGRPQDLIGVDLLAAAAIALARK